MKKGASRPRVPPPPATAEIEPILELERFSPPYGRPPGVKRTRPVPVARYALLATFLLAAVAAGVMGSAIGRGIDRPGDVRLLSRAALVPVRGDLPKIRAKLGRAARVQVSIVERVGRDHYRALVVRRAGRMGPGTVEVKLGSGHLADGDAPGRVIDNSRLLPFKVVEGQRGGLPPGRYAAQLHLRSRR